MGEVYAGHRELYSQVYSSPRKGKCKNKNHPSDSKMLTGSHHITSELATTRSKTSEAANAKLQSVSF
jgi:hypothetical protein